MYLHSHTMKAHIVSFEIRGLTSFIFTLVTFMWLWSGVFPNMDSHVVFLVRVIVTNETNIPKFCIGSRDFKAFFTMTQQFSFDSFDKYIAMKTFVIFYNIWNWIFLKINNILDNFDTSNTNWVNYRTNNTYSILIKI